MLSPARHTRSLQRQCAQCRRGQNVRPSALYHIVVPNTRGGTRREGGFDCRYCGFANVIPATALPPGLLPALPSQAKQREAAAALVAGNADAPAQEEPAPGSDMSSAGAQDLPHEPERPTMAVTPPPRGHPRGPAAGTSLLGHGTGCHRASGNGPWRCPRRPARHVLGHVPRRERAAHHP